MIPGGSGLTNFLIKLEDELTGLKFKMKFTKNENSIGMNHSQHQIYLPLECL